MADVLGDEWVSVAGPTLCRWCRLELKPGDEHGVIEWTREGGAAVTCRVKMTVRYPRQNAQISGIPAPQGDEG